MIRYVSLVSLAAGVAGELDTSITVDLNRAISKSINGVYTNGKGVMMRTTTGDLHSDLAVVPATMIHNDIKTPSSMYPGNFGSVWCPNNGDTGYSSADGCAIDPISGYDNPWNFAQMGIAVLSALPEFFTEYDSIQDDSWGYGVFYATDSNSVDKRCWYSAYWDGWDCPGGWITSDGTWTVDTTKKGSGYYPPGNPYVNATHGGGTGCHFASYSPFGIDQTNAAGKLGSILKDKSCQCNYDYSNDWDLWVTAWISGATAPTGFEWEGWFTGGKAPSFAVDLVACWMNNPRDMIQLQNAIHFRRFEWSNQLIPQSVWDPSDAASERLYWGWNEVPVSRVLMNDPSNWDAVIIKLPAGVCSQDVSQSDVIGCLTPGSQLVLERDLATTVSQGMLIPGRAALATRPGSYTVVMTEDMHDDSSWSRAFSCAIWVSPTQKFEMVYEAISLLDTYGACYISVPAVTIV